MELLDEKDLAEVNGGTSAGMMGLSTSKLKSRFEKACKRKKMDEIFQLLGELQARGEYSWAKETAGKYGVNCF